MKFTWHEYKTLNWRGGKLSPQQADLLFLLVVRRTAVTVEEIIDFIWPDPDKQSLTARQIVRRQVREIRKKFGQDIIRTANYNFGYWVTS